MNKEINAGGIAVQKMAMDIADQALASDDPIRFIRGAVSLFAGVMSGAVGHDAIIEILLQTATAAKNHAERHKSQAH